MALKRLDGGEALIHHSDRGCQYASNDYVSLLCRHNISISMTESGNPKDNAQAEYKQHVEERTIEGKGVYEHGRGPFCYIKGNRLLQ